MRNNDYVFACVLSLMPRFFQVCYPAPHPGTHTACEAGGPPPIHLQGAINPGQRVHLLRDPLAVARKIQSRQETISNKTQAMARRSEHFQAASLVKRRSAQQFAGNIGYKKQCRGGPRCTSRCQFSLPHPLRGSGANVECRTQNNRTRRSPSIFQTRCRW